MWTEIDTLGNKGMILMWIFESLMTVTYLM